MHVVATAGHVDHGKSTLVRALTGMEPDRWAEEKRRGMTIDLGFAWTTLASGTRLAFVDVPGHERFLTNMLAGVGPAPAVLFVVAADEGWMPQSQEHLDAIDALGVRHGLLVVTRSDLFDPELATDEALDRIRTTALGDVEAIAVSSTSGAGLDRLRVALDDLAASLPSPDLEAPVRLWIDRVFTVRGNGTVVTGTLAGGRIRTGDELRLEPSGRTVRVRALQSLKESVAEAQAVSRIAVNLRGVEHTEVSRGMALLSPDAWTLTKTVDVRIDIGTAADRRPDNVPSEALAHIGTTRVQAGIRPLSPHWPSVPIARLTFRMPLPLHVGDRMLLRIGEPGAPGRHIVGACVLDVRPPTLRRRGSAARRAEALEPLADPVDGGFHLHQHGVLPASAFPAMGCPVPHGTSVAGWVVDPMLWDGLGPRLSALVEQHTTDHPLNPGLPVDTARRLLGLPDRRLVDALVSAPLHVEQGRIHPGSLSPALPEPVAVAVKQLAEDLTRHPFHAPETERLAELGLDRRAVGAAVRAGMLLRITEGVVLLPGADIEAFRRLARGPQPFTAGDARRALDSTRRVVIPLLEHLERMRLTERVGPDHHRCRPAPDTDAP